MDAAKSVMATFNSTSSNTSYLLEVHVTEGNNGFYKPATTGVVTSSPAGINCPYSCSSTFPSGSRVTLRTTTTNKVVKWSGCGTSCYMNEKKCVSVFIYDPYTDTLPPPDTLLNVRKTGQGSGTVTGTVATGSKVIDCGSDCSYEKPSWDHCADGVLTLTASPASGSSFAGWSGSCSGTSLQCTPSGSSREVIATFIPSNSYTLTVRTTGTGNGTVTSTPLGINCGNDCMESYATGGTVRLTASAANGSRFTGWGGACSGTTSTSCTVTMNAAQNVTATFSPIPTYALTVNKAGTGSGTVSSDLEGISRKRISCGNSCTESYFSGTDVRLTATANNGFTFAGWSGACSGTSTSCTVKMDTAKTATATFVPNYILTISTISNPTTLPIQGWVTSSPTGINCGSDCTEGYASSTNVTLTAGMRDGANFAGWSGACSGTSTSCTVKMDTAKTATATFVRPFYSLTVSSNGTGGGHISSSPLGINCGSVSDCQESYPNGTTVTLTAEADKNSTFVEWIGACSGRTKTCTVKLDGAKNVTAIFNSTIPSLLTVSRAGAGKGMVCDSLQVGGHVSLPVLPTCAGTNGRINCGYLNSSTDCYENYPKNYQVTLLATPAADATFAGWSGACSGTSTICQVTMDTAKSVTANFDRAIFPLTVVKSGTGASSGFVTSALTISTLDDINCGSQCTKNYPSGTTVRLYAFAGANYEFSRWSGPCRFVNSCTLGPCDSFCEVSVNAATTIMAHFYKPAILGNPILIPTSE
jgi:uncharacterized repeat protein (TIGR02543 family)